MDILGFIIISIIIIVIIAFIILMISGIIIHKKLSNEYDWEEEDMEQLQYLSDWQKKHKK